MLGVRGYKHKKDLIKAVGTILHYEETSVFGLEFKPNGINTVVGPDAYRKRDWFAEVICENGRIVKVK